MDAPKLPLEIEDIKRILPHRYPFLFVDRVLEILALAEVEVEPPPAAICSKRVAEYLEGIAKVKDRVILLLSAGKLLTRSEQEGLESASKPQAGSKIEAAAKPPAATKPRSKRSS